MSLEGRHIIFDTDMGPDDAWSLILLLKLLPIQKFKFLGITCTHGNGPLDHVGINTIRVLEAVDRLDIPVYLGAKNGFLHDRNIKKTFFGENGFGDVEYETEPDISVIRSENAVSAMYRMAKESPEKVTIIALGPLTNVALTLRTYPDFTDYIAEIHIMGGNYKGQGNIRASAEFNFFLDPESAHVVLNVTGKQIFIAPWETALPPQLHLTPEWRFNVLGAIDNNITRLLNPAEEAYRPLEVWSPSDFLSIASLVYPEKIIKEAHDRHVSVELNGQLSRGQMVIDHLKQNPPNAKVIELVHIEEIQKLFLWTAGHEADPKAKGT